MSSRALAPGAAVPRRGRRHARRRLLGGDLRAGGSLRALASASPTSSTWPTPARAQNAHGGPGNGTVSAFRDARDGTLTPIGSSPFADQQTAPCWVEISHDGDTLFVVDGGTSQDSAFRVHGGSLTELPFSPTALPAGAKPFGIVVS